MKSAGILTFHNVPNYGANLQAFALRTYLQKHRGLQTSIVDFQCRGNSDEFVPDVYLAALCRSGSPLKSMVKRILVSLFAARRYRKKHRAFAAFAKEYLPQIPYGGDAWRELDYLLCGSDQIWNGEITAGLQPPYFGADRAADSQTVAAAYAASCGDVRELDAERRRELFSMVARLDHVGVRERSLQQALLAEGIDAVHTLDPTFLLSREEYTDALELPTPCEQGTYVLEYALAPSPLLDAVAERVAAREGLRVVRICGYVPLRPEKGIFDAGPREFLALLARASHVVTNSFHGTAFSLIFEKQFHVVLPHGRRGRLTDLLGDLFLEARICECVEDVREQSVSYADVSVRLSAMAEQSRQYLADVVGGEGDHGTI